MGKAAHPYVSAIATITERVSEASPLRGDMNSLRMAAEALDSVRLSRSPLDTPAAHVLKVAKKAKQFREQATASFNRAAETYASRLRDIEQRIDSKVSLKPNEYGEEIRRRYRELDGKARSQFIKEMIDSNDAASLAAITRAPPVLSGHSKEQLAAFEQAIIKEHAAPELAERDALIETFDSVSAAVGAADKFAKELTDPATLSEIERADAEATAAGEAFSAAMQ